MSEVNPSIAALNAEIEVRQEELDALRTALTILETARASAQPNGHGAAAKVATPRKRRRMSAAARKLISKRMRAYWKAQRAER